MAKDKEDGNWHIEAMLSLDERDALTRPTDGDLDREETWFIVISMSIVLGLCFLFSVGVFTWLLNSMPWWMK